MVYFSLYAFKGMHLVVELFVCLCPWASLTGPCTTFSDSSCLELYVPVYVYLHSESTASLGYRVLTEYTRHPAVPHITMVRYQKVSATVMVKVYFDMFSCCI